MTTKLILAIQILLALFVISLISCTPTTQIVPNQITSALPTETIVILPTLTPTPTPTQTPIPLESIKIDPDIFKPEDLGLIGGEMFATNPGIWVLRDVEVGVNNITRKFIDSGGDIKGYVSVFLYKSPENLQLAFDQAKANIEGNSLVEIINLNIGDNNIAFKEYYDGIIYTKGNAFVCVTFREMSFDAIEFYTKGLDERLVLVLGAYY
jgi:hypothetical protein